MLPILRPCYYGRLAISLGERHENKAGSTVTARGSACVVLPSKFDTGPLSLAYIHACNKDLFLRCNVYECGASWTQKREERQVAIWIYPHVLFVGVQPLLNVYIYRYSGLVRFKMYSFQIFSYLQCCLHASFFLPRNRSWHYVLINLRCLLLFHNHEQKYIHISTYCI